tara:strand:+ start:2019 stop:2795 length:777 start_codon:yes stop_codon:yes gene_type:complete
LLETQLEIELMSLLRRDETFRWWYKKGFWFWTLVVISLIILRISKGALLIDIYSFLSRPFWPGHAQKEWILNGINLEQQIKLDVLEKDNQRLRELLSLQSIDNNKRISAVVISRNSNGFWQQLDINKGSLHGVKVGHAVIGPGGLLGLITRTTMTTSRVRLLTAPGSKIGVWVERTKVHGVLVGNSNNRPQITFFDKSPDVELGDVITTSPASTLMPPNLTVGVIQKVHKDNLPEPYAFVQLLATPEAIDWVQVVSWK